MKKVVGFLICLSMFLPTSVFALDEQEDDLSQYSYSVSDDENFQDGVMSNPDGYEGTGHVIEDNSRSLIYQSMARGSGYNLTWGYENGKKAMYDGDGIRFGYGECKKVIDVSSYNGGINWSAVKSSGIDGAILRITSFAGGNMHEDAQFSNNLQGCRNVGMPRGIYMYSYATNTSKAANEANYVVGLLKKYGVRPSDLQYPVYYDMESNSSVSGLSVDQNAANAETFISILNANGYTANVYSYTSYLNTNLNSPRIYKYVSWVAQYGKKLRFVNSYYKGNYGWQYQSNGHVSGISGEVDISCFSNFYGYDTQNHTNQSLGRGSNTPYLEYRANSSGVGWLPYFVEPNTAGTTGRSLPLYQLQFKLNNMPNSSHLSGVIKNTSQTLTYDNIENEDTIGTDGKAMRQVMFNLKNVAGYHLEYRVHSADLGWQNWVKQGNYAGNASKDIQAIDFRLVADNTVTVVYPQIYYRGHIADTGWLSYVPDSQIAGTVGKGIALQALQFGMDGEDNYSLNGKVYVAGTGWKEYTNIKSNTVLGTTGQNKAIKAVNFKFNNFLGYKLQYCVHLANKGWQSWVNEGTDAGDKVNNIEAIKFRLVTDNGVINKITLNKTSVTLEKGNTDLLSISYRPASTTMDKTIKWSSSNTDIVTVDTNGKIHAVGTGNATITAETVNGLKATCQVKSIISISSIQLNKTSETLEKGKTIQLSATINPTNTTEDKTLTWTSSNSNVATVDKNGNVKAVGGGDATINVKSKNGKVATCKIHVLSHITSVTLNKNTLSLSVGNSEALKATINPSDTTDNRKLTWSSDNSNIAKVDQDGKVTGVALGTTNIKVTTSNGKSTTCKVTIVKPTPSVNYQAHVQDIGWQGYVKDGNISGTSGRSKRLEAIKIKLSNNSFYKGTIQYQTHIQDIGWQGWKNNDVIAGTSGQSKRLEAIRIKLTDDLAKEYDIYYRVHAQYFGWLGWAKNGESAGTAGYSYRLEAIQIKLVKKNGSAPGSTYRPYIQRYVSYQTHVQDIGWQGTKYDGEMSGTSGRSKRLEAINISLSNPLYSGGIQYQSHVQDIGWQGWKANGQMSGTSGRSKRLEAIRIRLTGEMANKYDVYYRVHVQNFGWLGWAKNGESSGTEGYSYRLEAIQIKLVNKNGSAPGSTSNKFYKR
ncbi:MAG: Ig-like domain-containing protein [Bacillota bacterium]|nr:Ig-like domain-containing protein [Bacillota bacterium]